VFKDIGIGFQSVLYIRHNDSFGLAKDDYYQLDGERHRQANSQHRCILCGD